MIRRGDGRCSGISGIVGRGDERGEDERDRAGCVLAGQ
jgi:hypothetical protein